NLFIDRSGQIASTGRLFGGGAESSARRSRARANVERTSLPELILKVRFNCRHLRDQRHKRAATEGSGPAFKFSYGSFLTARPYTRAGYDFRSRHGSGCAADSV